MLDNQRDGLNQVPTHDAFELAEGYSQDQRGRFNFQNSGKNKLLLASTLVVLLLIGFASIFVVHNCSTKEEPKQCLDQGDNYPLGAHRYPKVLTPEKQLKFQQRRKAKNISLQSLILMRYYIALGLQDPNYAWIKFEKQYIEKKYNVSKYTKEIPICLAITSYNNVKNSRIQYNLKSVFRQDYKNYQIVYLDDASTDNTTQEAKRIFAKYNFDESRLTMVKNKINKGSLYNHVQMAKNYCKPESIFIIFDGDDAMQGTQTLKLLNAIYQQKQVWYVYTNYFPIWQNIVGVSQDIPEQIMKNNSYRKYSTEGHWITSHMRTFYTKLFVSVPQRAFKYPNGTYIGTACDKAQIYPMQQMAQQKFIYVPELTYIYLDLTDNSQWRTRNTEALQVVKMLGNYPIEKKLSCLFKTKDNKCIPSNDLINRMDQFQPTIPAS